MKKKFGILSICLVLLVSLLCGCGKIESTVSEEIWNNTASVDGEMGYSDYVKEDMAEAPEEESLDMTTKDEVEEVENTTKIIRRVNMSIETLYFDEMVALLTNKAGQYGGYVENSEVYNNGYYGSGRRSADFIVRIPAADADAYMESIGDKGVVVSKSENLEDVTLQYVDTQSHIDMLKVEQERLMELLNKAETLEDILMIEDRLTSVRYELESYESQLKVMENKINYTTITIDVREVEQITTPEKATMWDKIRDTFGNSLRGIRDAAVWFIVFFVGNFPYFIILALLIAAALLIVKKREKKK